jgi:hypothetical protein
VKNKSPSRSSRKQPTGTKQTGGATQEKPVALTLKVDGSTYVRLSTLRATQRRTSQDILRQALEEYLDRAGA